MSGCIMLLTICHSDTDTTVLGADARRLAESGPNSQPRIERFEQFGVACPAAIKLNWAPRMKHQLDFEKPITELQNKLDELRKHPETHSLSISFKEEIAQIEKKIAETRKQIFS